MEKQDYTRMHKILSSRATPLSPREWTVTAWFPRDLAQVRLSNEEVDAIAAHAARPGWTVVGTIVCSRRQHSRDTWDGWYLRVKLVPDEWVKNAQLRAPVAVYAAAQMAGCHTHVDDVLSADAHGVQYRTPDGRPTVRCCGEWDGIEALPPNVRAAVDEIVRVGMRRRVGYVWGRPNTGRAQLVAMAELASDKQSEIGAKNVIRDYIREHHPLVEVGRAA